MNVLLGFSLVDNYGFSAKKLRLFTRTYIHTKNECRFISCLTMIILVVYALMRGALLVLWQIRILLYAFPGTRYSTGPAIAQGCVQRFYLHYSGHLHYS